MAAQVKWVPGVAIVLALVLPGCSRDDEEMIPKDLSTFPRAEAPSACRAQGGTWFPGLGDPTAGACRIPTPDAGAACRSSDDCAAFCVVKVQPEPLLPGDRVVGQCVDSYYVTDCFELVEDGRYQGRLCID